MASQAAPRRMHGRQRPWPARLVVAARPRGAGTPARLRRIAQKTFDSARLNEAAKTPGPLADSYAHRVRADCAPGWSQPPLVVGHDPSAERRTTSFAAQRFGTTALEHDKGPQSSFATRLCRLATHLLRRISMTKDRCGAESHETAPGP